MEIIGFYRCGMLLYVYVCVLCGRQCAHDAAYYFFFGWLADLVGQSIGRYDGLDF